MQAWSNTSEISAARKIGGRDRESGFYASTHLPWGQWRPGLWVWLLVLLSLLLLLLLPMGRLVDWLPVAAQKCLLFLPVLLYGYHEWRRWCRPGALGRVYRRGDAWLLEDGQGKLRTATYDNFAWFSAHFCFLYLRDDENRRIPLLLTGRDPDTRRLRVWLRYREPPGSGAG